MISVPDKWWAQVDSSHSPTYCAFILRISAVFVLSFAHVIGGLKCSESLSDVLRLYTSYKRRLCSLLRSRYWWAQVDSSHSPTYRAFILRISAVFVLSFAHVIGGLKWIRTTDLALIRRTL